jgi:hypothetical protein
MYQQVHGGAIHRMVSSGALTPFGVGQAFIGLYGFAMYQNNGEPQRPPVKIGGFCYTKNICFMFIFLFVSIKSFILVLLLI